MNECLARKPLYSDVTDWFDEDFKVNVKQFLIDFSILCRKSQRETKSLFFHYLQNAVKTEDWELVAFCRSRLKTMNYQESMGIIIRSRQKEFTEFERLSLYFLNRELKKGSSGSVSKLSKYVNNVKVVEEDQSEIEAMTTEFYFKLFQGHHRSSGIIDDSPFEPDFTNLHLFTDGLGRLSQQQSDSLTRPITTEEVSDAIKTSSNNKSPGLDGITYEFYKKCDILLPILVEVFNQQLATMRLIPSNSMGATRLISKVPPDQVPLVEELRPITLLNSDYKILTKVISKRIIEILPYVIRSPQSCSVNGTNICVAASFGGG